MFEESSADNNLKIAGMLMGDSEMSERIRQFDWSKTPLGSIEKWQQSLITAVNLVLNSRFSMFLWWGEDLNYFYNDAYLPTLGIRHPAALGKSAREVWAEIWDVIGPQAEAVIERGESSWNEELLLFLERHGFPEETYHTFSYSPIADDFGKIGGLFCAVSEDTQKVLSRRRLQTLRDLGERTLEEARNIEEACRVACQTLSENKFDVTFSLIYLLDKDEKKAFLHELSGIEFDHQAAPSEIQIGTKEDVWEFSSVLEIGRGKHLSDIEERFGRLSAGAWEDDRTREAFVLPLAKAGVHNSPTGFLICGISPRLRFSDEYRSFLELAAGHIATAIANARVLEEERKRAEALAEIDRAKTEFFSNVSHEFRTPLTLMLGNLEEVLANNNQLPAVEKNQIETAHRNSLRLLKLVNTLLDFSRIEAGRQEAEFVAIELSEFTAELASNFESAIESAGLRLKIDCPPLSEEVYVDRDMWEKIVLNLISNAFKFTFRGEIEVALREGEKDVELKVKDTGVGIPADQLEEIFKRFHRVRQSEGRTFEGTGIGLSLVQELVKQHGGDIRVESESGIGSVFTVSLPKGKAHLPSDQITENAAGLSAKLRADVFLNEITDLDHQKLSSNTQTVNDSDNLKSYILLADDNQDMREYVRRLLESEGYLVKTAADGQAALEILQNEETLPNLILSDVMMPRLDGFQLLEEIRKNPQTREIPIIMLSARAGEESKVEGLESGADDYLVKPFAAREMLARVKTNLEMVRIRRESSRREAEILESVGDCFMALDLDYRFVYFNRCAESYFGMSRNEVLGKILWEVFPMAKESIFAEKYQQASESKEIVRFEATSIIKKNGWIEVDVYPSEKGLSIYFRDITKRRQAEEKLRESEERFRNMADHAPVMIWVTEADSKCSYLSQSWYEFTGQTPETGLGFGWLEAVHPEDKETSAEIFAEANENQKDFRLEYRLRRKDGEYRWAIDSAHPRFDRNGRFLGYIGSVIDITERKEAEEKLQASENQLRLVTDSLPVLISYVDANFHYRFVNKIYEDWFGMSAGEIIGKPIREIIGKDAFERILPKLQSALQGERVVYEQLMPYKTVGNRYVEINLVPDREKESGKVRGFYALIQDIGERKRVEEKLRMVAEMDSYRVRLSDALREIDSPMEVQLAASRLLGEYLKANRVAYFEVHKDSYVVENDFVSGVPHLAGSFPIESFGENLLRSYRAGKTVSGIDIESDQDLSLSLREGFASIQIRSFIGVPLIKEGEFVAGLAVHSSIPRKWTNEEIEVVEETAERTWAAVERARAEKAMRESQSHLNLTTEAANIGTWQWDVKTNRIFWNEIQQRMWGYEHLDSSADYGEGARLVLAEDLPLVESAIKKCLRGEENYDIEYRIKPQGKDEIRWIRSTGKAYFNEAGRAVSIQGISLDVTARKQAEEEIRLNEKRLRQLANGLPQLIWTCLPDGPCDFLSRQWVDYTGIPEAEQLGFGWLEQVHPEDRNPTIAAWNKAVESGSDFKVEFRIRRYDGVYRSFDTRAVRLLDAQGNTVKWFGSNTDVTDRTEQEELLRESEERYRIVAETASDAIISIDERSRVLFVNAAAERIFGYSAAEMLGSSLTMIMPDDLREKHLFGFYKYLETGKRKLTWESLEVPARHKDGHIFPLEISFGEYHQKDQRVFIGIARDITERKQIDKALRDSEALLQGSIDALTKHIAVLDWQGRIINVNAAWRRFAEQNSFTGSDYGIGSNYVEECVPIIGVNTDECNNHGTNAAEGIRAILEEQKSYFEMEYPCHSPTEKRWFLMRVTSFGTGENLHVVVAHENVTDRKLAELERERILEREQEARFQAENANRLKDEFLATVSHELRTPLNAILGWSTMARNESADTKTIQRALEVIERSARNQNQIISDILEVSRIITGKLQLNLQSVSLSQVISAAIDIVRPAIDAKTINLKVDLAAESNTIYGDIDRLQQIFWNLLSNAVKFTPDGGNIEVGLRYHSRFAEITVRDNGIGIEPEFLPFVFDRFRQADGKMNRKHGGLGLGLAIARHLTELHGGQVSVESEGGGSGAVFTVCLPLKSTRSKNAKDNSTTNLDPEEMNLGSSKKPLRKLEKLKIMVVDDEPHSLELASFILTENGAEVFTANSVDSALQIFEREHLDIIISDIGMPERDGYELIKEINSRTGNRQIPTLALTAYAREIDEKQLLQAGYRAYLPKPIEPSRLVEVVLELISKN